MWPAASTSRRVDPTWWQAPPAGITNQGSILARAQKTRSERRLRLRVVDRHDQLAGLDLPGQGLDPGLGPGGHDQKCRGSGTGGPVRCSPAGSRMIKNNKQKYK